MLLKGQTKVFFQIYFVNMSFLSTHNFRMRHVQYAVGKQTTFTATQILFH